MKTSERLFFIAFGVVATFIITMMLRDWFRKRQIARTLARRDPHDDDQFRKIYPDLRRADIAVRTRRVLANNLELPLNGLAPGDRLDDDLNAELAANPHLFWELEAEFGILTDVEDLEAHERTLERLVTFHDLVQYVESRISEPQPQTPGADESEKTSRAYDFAIRSIPILCIGGFVTAVAGILIQKRTFMNLGGLIFMSGVAVWGLANGGEMLRNTVQSARGLPRKEIAARPWPFLLLTCFALFFLWIGGTVLWGVLKNLLSTK